MNRERCILILEGYGAGPWMIRLIQTYWRDAIMVCRATPQGGLLSVKLFNILVDAIARKWLRVLQEGGDYEMWELDDLMSTFAIF